MFSRFSNLDLRLFTSDSIIELLNMHYISVHDFCSFFSISHKFLKIINFNIVFAPHFYKFHIVSPYVSQQLIFGLLISTVTMHAMMHTNSTAEPKFVLGATIIYSEMPVSKITFFFF